MAASGSYKRYDRAQRGLQNQTAFGMGMRYVNDPLMDGEHRVLLNYDLINKGDSMEVRDGLVVDTAIDTTIDSPDVIIHHQSIARVEDTLNGTDELKRYVLAGKDTADGVEVANSILVVEDEDTRTKQVYTLVSGYTGPTHLRVNANENWNTMHGMSMESPLEAGLFATVNGVTFLLGKTGSTFTLCKLKLTHQDETNHEFDVEIVQPDEITPREAINYGYNILDDDPYNFVNEATAGVLPELLGILPYHPANNTLMFDANIGAEIKFTLNYKYPSADSGKTYVTKWRVYDLQQQNEIVTIQTVSESPDYTPGDDIFVVRPGLFHQFAVIVDLYDKATYDYVNEATNVALASMTLPSYHLTEDNPGNTKGIQPKNFDLTQATGMAEWNHRLVLWGVPGAETLLFTSEPLNPNYFPFPNNVDLYDDEIIGGVKYLGDFAVFTTSTLYKAKLDETALFVGHEVIQEKLYLDKADLNTIKLVKNMIYFKSDDYYYMVVPKVNSDGTNALQLAPISSNIALLFDNFEREMREIIGTLYQFDNLFGSSEEGWKMDLQYFYNYLDGVDVTNNYVFKVYTVELPAEAKFVEASLIYDTMMRTWRMSAKEVNGQPVWPYRQTVTTEAVFTNIYMSGTDSMIQYITRQKDGADTFNLDDAMVRTFDNWQYWDTGNRDQDPIIKKRFREVQLRINNLSQEDLEFFAALFVDDQERKGLYDYEVVHVTDPASPNYGLISVVPVLRDPTVVNGATVLDQWKLGLSQFPPLTIIKVRIKMTGKGYAGRMKLLSKNQVQFEILSNTWVYRTMNAR